MKLHLIGLPLAFLSVVRAGIFQRQCYPETVLVTVTANPVTSTCTETVVSVSTATITARPHTSTVTSEITSLITIQGPLQTVTETLQGPDHLSISYTSLLLSASPSTSKTNCVDSSSCEVLSVHGSPLLSTVKTIPATTTVHLVITATVVPLATLIPSLADEKTNVVSPMSSVMNATSGTKETAVPTNTATATIGVTETVHLTSFLTQPINPTLFPTLNVTGSMGISFSSNGSASASFLSGLTSTSSITGANASASTSTFAAMATNSLNASLASSLTFPPSSELNSFVTALTPTMESASSSTFDPRNITHGLPIPFGSSQLTPFINSTLAITTQVQSLTVASLSTTLSTTFQPNTTTSVGGTRGPLPIQPTLSPTGSSSLTASSANLTEASIAQQLNASTATGAMETLSILSAGDLTVTVQTTSQSSGLTFPTAFSSGIGQSFTPASNLETHSSAPFPNSTDTFLTASGTPTVPASNSSTTIAATGPVRRCVGGTPPATLEKLKLIQEPLSFSVLNDGKVVTFPWARPASKRQVGNMVTATINGIEVTWLNNWDGTSMVNLPSTATLQPALTWSVTTSVSTTTKLGDGATQQTSSTIDSTFLVSQSKAAITTTSTGVVLTTPSANNGQVVSSIVVTTKASEASGISLEASTQAATDQFPTFKPPAWLTSLVPIAPTAPLTTATASFTPVFGPWPQTGTIDALLSSATAESMCQDNPTGRFTITFDDLPQSGQSMSTDQYPPLINPYHKLLWSQGFSYAPPPTDPYEPHSGHQLGMFIVDGNANIHSQNWTGPIPQGDEVNGMFGAGAHYKDPQYYIDAFGAWLGCQNSGPAYCDIQINGYGYDDASGESLLQVEQHFYQEPCKSLRNCSLQYFEFNEAFHNLTALQILATQQGDQSETGLTWYIDDLSLGWTDTSCAAAKARNSTLIVGH